MTGLGLVLLCPTLASAQVVVALVNAHSVPGAERVQRSAEAIVKQLSALAVGEGPVIRKGAPRRCDDDCIKAMVKQLTPQVLTLDLKSAGTGYAIEAAWWSDGAPIGSRRAEVSAALEAELRDLIEPLVPPWARKGYGALVMPSDRSIVLKVDGRIASGKPGTLYAVPAGPHSIDLVFADGNALLQRLEVGEGQRLPVRATAPPTLVENKELKTGITPLRGVSYALFMSGALAVASGFIAAAIARWNLQGLEPCLAGSTRCASLDTALAKASQAQTVTLTGNVLLVAGLALMGVGAGLFTIDAVTE